MSFKYKNKFVTTVINKKHLWINEYTQQIVIPNWDKCRFNKDVYYCETDEPVKEAQNHDTCVWQAYKNTTMSNCVYIGEPQTEKWIKINANTWIFCFFNATEVQIICREEVTKFTLKNCGVLRFQIGCIVKSDKNEVRSEKTIKSEINESIKFHNIVAAKIDSLHESKIVEDIDGLKDADWWQFYHNCHHYTTIYVAIIAIVLVAIIFYNKLELKPIP